MRLSYGTTVVTAGIAVIMSFGLLAAAIGSEYWYIIVVNRPNETDSEDLNSHSGLWRIYEGKDDIAYNIYSFSADTSKYSDLEKHLLSECKGAPWQQGGELHVPASVCRLGRSWMGQTPCPDCRHHAGQLPPAQ